MIRKWSERLNTLSGTFWAANTLELFERLAYYGLFNLLALYLTNSKETGALGFTQVQKGMLMGIVNAILYFLPIITGAIADRLGYKKVLFISFCILTSGYYLMGQVSSYPSVFASFLYIATGAALFKPIISATIARTTNESNAGIGFGLFYMIINLGGLIGPLMASWLREMNWKYIFLMSSGSILLNMVILLIFFKEPQREIKNEPFFKTIRGIFVNIFTVLKDLQFVLFLVIVTGAWTVYWQYFYSLPVFIEQWVDTSALYQAIYRIWPGFAKLIGTTEGTILTEKIITIDAFFIVIMQILVSSAIVRFKPLPTMMFGIFINALGLTLSFLTPNPMYLVGSILIFSLGEMTFYPKVLEYVSRIAPPEKAALYMGTQFLSLAAGNFLGGFLSGKIYLNLADKYMIIREQFPEVRSVSSNQELMSRVCTIQQLDEKSINGYLWATGHPWNFGLLLMGIGFITVLTLFLFHVLRDKSK
jgi:proton-dependent oligopeptide transporter, POT family